MSCIPSLSSHSPKEEIQELSFSGSPKNEQIKTVQELSSKYFNLMPGKGESENSIKKIKSSNDEEKQNLESRVGNESEKKSGKLTEANILELVDLDESFAPTSWKDFLSSSSSSSSSRKRRAEVGPSCSKKRRVEGGASSEEKSVSFNVNAFIKQDESYKSKLSFTPGPGDCSLEDEDFLLKLEGPWER